MVFATDKSTTTPPTTASVAELKSTSTDTDGQAETARTDIVKASSTDTAQAEHPDTLTAGTVMDPSAETNIKLGTTMDSHNFARPVVSDAAVASPSAAVASPGGHSQNNTTPYSSPNAPPQMLSPNAAQRLFTICTPDGFELYKEYTKGQGMIDVNTFQLAADAASYARSGQAGILISAGYGRATTPHAQKLYRNSFCSNTTKFKNEKDAAIGVIIPMIKFGQSFGDISVTLSKSKMILLDDSPSQDPSKEEVIPSKADIKSAFQAAGLLSSEDTHDSATAKTTHTKDEPAKELLKNSTSDSGSALTPADAPVTGTKNVNEDYADATALTIKDNEDGKEIEFTKWDAANS